MYDALHEAKSKFYKYQQGDNESLADHMRNFKDLCSSIEYHGGDTFFNKDMQEREIRADVKDKITDTTGEEYRSRVVGKAKAVAFLKSANRKTYGKLLMSIREQHSFKIDVYPKTLADAYKMLSAHTPHNSSNNQGKQKKDNRQSNTNINNNNNERSTSEPTTDNNTDTGTSYLQTDVVPGTDGRLISHISCYNCGRKGHYADNCPGQVCTETNEQQHVQTQDNSDDDNSVNGADTNEQLLQMGEPENEHEIVHFSWNQMNTNNRDKYKDTDILIDTGSTFSVFKNPQMLLNIRRGERKMTAYTNGGQQDSTLVGDLPGFFEVWYNPNSMINILAWSNVADRYRITSDTAKGRYISVHLSDDRKMNFVEVESGLYLFRDRVHATTKNKMSGYSYLMLTEANMKDFTEDQVKKAERARDLHRGMGFPGYKKFL